jgi:hypothetical protein
MPQLAEILPSQPVERGAVQLRGAPDEVMDLGLEGLPLGVVPGVLGDVAVVDEHVVHAPVRGLARKPVATLEEQDALARRREAPRERAPARSGSDDHDVVALHGHDTIHGVCQPYPATRSSAACGPQLPGL